MDEQALANSEHALDSEPKKRGRPKEKLFPVKLLKNYHPAGEYEIAGYYKEPITVKDTAGRMHTVDPGGFQHGVAKPPIKPGVGTGVRIWAGTHIRLPAEEAMDVISKRIAERADELSA